MKSKNLEKSLCEMSFGCWCPRAYILQDVSRRRFMRRNIPLCTKVGRLVFIVASHPLPPTHSAHIITSITHLTYQLHTNFKPPSGSRSQCVPSSLHKPPKYTVDCVLGRVQCPHPVNSPRWTPSSDLSGSVFTWVYGTDWPRITCFLCFLT